jgi:hypothetical protein
VPVELVSTVASSQRPRPLEFVALAATLLWVALALLHPGGIGNEPAPYEGIADDANKWIFVHFSQLVLTPFVAVGMWMLLDGTQSIAATVARASLVIWMVFFSAFDAVAGIAVGVLTRYANSLAGEEQQAVIGAIDFLFQDSKFAAAITSLSSESWVNSAGSLSSSPRLWRSGGRGPLVLSSERPFSPCSSLPTPAIQPQSG